MEQRILVVDDDKKIVRLVRAFLEQTGFQVLVRRTCQVRRT